MTTPPAHPVWHTYRPVLEAFVYSLYEDWTSREAAVRLGEHQEQELRMALGLERVPDDTTRYRFLRRLDSDVVTQALPAMVARLPPATPTGMVVAVDATGLAPTAASRYFVDLTRNRGAERTRQHWPKWVVAVDVLRRVVLGQLAYAGPAHASALLRPVVDRARPRHTADRCDWSGLGRRGV